MYNTGSGRHSYKLNPPKSIGQVKGYNRFPQLGCSDVTET